MQMSARTPAATAMAAMSLDHLSGGRFILGLGASGPQVVEGWYGEPYPKPLARTREYVEIVRRIVAREAPVEFHGDHYDIPLQGGAGLGKALKSTIHPLRPKIPVYLAAEGPKNVALAAEICDGWLPLFFSPSADAFYRERLAEGFAASGDPSRADTFEIAATVTIIPGDDVEACADFIRPFLALYAGGMGATRRQLPLRGVRQDGLRGRARPRSRSCTSRARSRKRRRRSRWQMVEDVALVGPPDKIRADLERWRETCLTTMLIGGPAQSLGATADLING